MDSAEEKIKNAEEIEPESKKPNVDGDERIKASQEETQEVILAEDGTNYLVGPTEINLYRTDHYHPLFSTYRKSTDIRKENFLSSKHLQHVSTSLFHRTSSWVCTTFNEQFPFVFFSFA